MRPLHICWKLSAFTGIALIKSANAASQGRKRGRRYIPPLMVNVRVTNLAPAWPEQGKWLTRLRLAAALAIEKGDSDGVAIDPGKPAVAVGQSPRRQHQEELRQLQSRD